MADLPPSTNPRWHRRYWNYYNRPYSGCGCFYTLAMFILFWWLLSLFIPAIAIW